MSFISACLSSTIIKSRKLSTCNMGDRRMSWFCFDVNSIYDILIIDIPIEVCHADITIITYWLMVLNFEGWRFWLGCSRDHTTFNIIALHGKKWVTIRSIYHGTTGLSASIYSLTRKQLWGRKVSWSSWVGSWFPWHLLGLKGVPANSWYRFV